MRRLSCKTSALALLIASASPAFSQQAGGRAQPPASATLSSETEGADRLTQLIGAEVTGADAGPVGVVNDVLIDHTGAVRGIVVAVAGARGLGEKNIALRREAMHVSQQAPHDGPTPPDAIAQPGSLSVTSSLSQKDIAAAPDFAPSGRSATAGTPESVHEPKSSTESGGPG